MGKKQKKPFQSKKIQPKAIVKTPLVKAGSNVVPGLKPLAEFRQRDFPLTLSACSKTLGPRISGYVCVAGWEVQNLAVKVQRFKEVASSVGKVMQLYHGTAATNIADITRQGLQPGNSHCMFGSGIYMGPPIKAIGYRTVRNGKHYKSQDRRYILQVRAALGKIKECREAEKWSLSRLQEAGCHSVAGVAGITASWAGTLRYSENVVYSPDQVIVDRIFEYHQLVTDYGETKQTSSTCNLMIRDLHAAVPPGQKAFADVLQTKECCKPAAVQIRTTEGLCWVCNHCIAKNRLKVGSKITVRQKYRWRSETITARILEVLE